MTTKAKRLNDDDDDESEIAFEESLDANDDE